MKSQVKKHRRNMAVEQGEETYRMSVPVMESTTFGNSYETSFDRPPLFRSSDMVQVPVLGQSTRQRINQRETDRFGGLGQKTEKKLLPTFTNLQRKLEEAKQQLSIDKPKKLCNFSFQLAKGRQTITCGNMLKIDEMLDKLEESTINLQSNKQLVSAVRSKQHLVWANKVKGYYISEVAKGLIGINQRAMEHITISHQVLKSIEEIELPDQSMIPRKRVELKVAPQNMGKKVLVLDLDQTLFHCEEYRMNEEDFEVDIPNDNGTTEKVYVSIRPYALSFLKKAANNFEIIAFTASERSYANAILNQIDPDRLISHRLYRQHCVKLHNRVYVKDLSIINRDLSKMILVDNSPLSYLYQVENGVPILPFYSGEDSELLALERYLQKVKVVRDVRQVNMKTFKLYQYGRFEDSQTLVRQLYLQA